MLKLKIASSHLNPSLQELHKTPAARAGRKPDLRVPLRPADQPSRPEGA